MFSLEKINAKMAKGSKKKVKKPLEPKKKKAGSFLSLETSSALFKGVTEPSETDPIPKKKKDSIRYYNYSKLIEDVVEGPADDWGLSHKTPSKYKKSQFLKLNKTSNEIIEDAVNKQANHAARKKKTLKNLEVEEDMEVIETFPDSYVKEMEVVSVKKNVQRKRQRKRSDVNAHEVNLEKKKSKNELPLKELKDSDFETDVSNINLQQEECFDKDSLTIDSGMSNLYVDALTLSEDALLVAFFPNTVIHFCGNVWVKLLAGSIRVFGYIFSEGDLYPVFSHQSQSLLNIKVLEGKNVKQFSSQQLKERDIPSEWVQRLDVDETCQLAIIKLSRMENSSTKLIQASKVLSHIHVPNAADSLFEDVLGIKVVNLKAEKRNPLLREPSEWNKCSKSLLKEITKEPRIIIAGGKGVGKSTFFKYLINRFLSDSAVDAVACMDIDPGQPEFSLPSVLSLTKVVNPALGPSFTHTVDLSDQTQLLIGDISVTNVLMEYLSAVQKFKDLYSKKYSNIPLIVNTMGFTAGTGSDIMIAVLRILKPSHVIVIESPKPEHNYQHSLDPHFINNVTNRGIFDKKLFSTTLNYKVISFRTAASYQVKAKNLALRDLRIFSNLAKLWKDEEVQLNSFNCKTAIMIPYNSVAIHVIGSLLPVDHMLEAINANLVALCKIDDVYFEEIREELPRQIKNGSHWYTSCKCLGWGIVRGIDPVSRELHILTPLDNADVMLNVNALILTKICLPDYLFKLFSGGKGGPYLQLQECQNNENKRQKRINMNIPKFVY